MPADNFKGTLLRHFSALLIIFGLLLWLFFGLLHPDTNYLTENAEGIIVGGFVSIITLVVNSLFQSEATKQAARSTQIAHDAGVAAAMTTPSPTTAVGSDFTGTVPQSETTEPIPPAVANHG